MKPEHKRGVTTCLETKRTRRRGQASGTVSFLTSQSIREQKASDPHIHDTQDNTLSALLTEPQVLPPDKLNKFQIQMPNKQIQMNGSQIRYKSYTFPHPPQQVTSNKCKTSWLFPQKKPKRRRKFPVGGWLYTWVTYLLLNGACWLTDATWVNSQQSFLFQTEMQISLEREKGRKRKPGQRGRIPSVRWRPPKMQMALF